MDYFRLNHSYWNKSRDRPEVPCFNVVSFTSGTSVLSVTVARASVKLKLV